MRNLVVYGLWLYALGACSWMPWSDSAEPPPPASPSDQVEIISGGLLASPSGDNFELSLTVVNRSAQTLWIRTHFHTPGGLSDCVVAKEMAAQATELFICRQTVVLADTEYPVQVIVFSDLEQLNEIDRLSTTLTFD